MKDYDVIIAGAGVAGLNCALHLPHDKRVLVICKDEPEKSDSYLAQGGISRLKNESDYESYFSDTMRAGHGENNPDAVGCMIRSSQAVVEELVNLGVGFAREKDGSLACTREGGHSTNRICFHKDCTGREITSRLMQKVRALKNVTVKPHTVLLDIIENGECSGAVVWDKASGEVRKIFSDYTVLATGGIGGVFKKSTNFRILTGDGVAICLNRGIAVDNINYVQIHPTTLYSEREGRSFLISESVRGEGAVLLDKNFNRFTDELQPRDVVTKAIYAQMQKDGTPYVWLDMRPIAVNEIRSHFPGIVERCAEEGIDVFKSPVPVVPAQHYFMGGIRSGLEGRTELPRLYAVGETCCNGVHGANRLASNSLLESLLFAKRAAEDIAANYESAKSFADADLKLYENPQQILENYKSVILNAIREAENVRPRNN